MKVRVAVQRALEQNYGYALPDDRLIRRWAEAAIRAGSQTAVAAQQLTVRIVERDEIRQLNQTYRHNDYATNVLSFAFEAPPGLPAAASKGELGDIVVCAAVVAQEAAEQRKPVEAHWAHMIVHGSLHLLGYDHEIEAQAQQMEALEIAILAGCGYPDPYGDRSELA